MAGFLPLGWRYSAMIQTRYGIVRKLAGLSVARNLDETIVPNSCNPLDKHELSSGIAEAINGYSGGHARRIH